MLKNVRKIKDSNLVYLNSGGNKFYLINMPHCPLCGRALNQDYDNAFLDEFLSEDEFLITCSRGHASTSRKENVLARIKELDYKENKEFNNSLSLIFLFDKSVMNSEFKYYAEKYEKCLKTNESSFNEKGIVHVQDVFLDLFVARKDCYTIENINKMKKEGFNPEFIINKLINSFFSRQRILRNYREKDF